MSVTSACRLAVVVVAVLGAPTPTSAQQNQAPAPPPYRGTFGGARPDMAARQAVELSASILEGFDDDLQVDTLGLAPAFQARGTYTALVAGLDFRFRGDTVQWRVSGGTDARHYPSLSGTVTASHYQTAGIAIRAPWRGRDGQRDRGVRRPFYRRCFLLHQRPRAPLTPIVPAAGYSLNGARYHLRRT